MTFHLTKADFISVLKFSFSSILLNTVSDRFLKSAVGLFLLLVSSLYFGCLVSNSSMPLNLSFAKPSVFITMEDPGHLPPGSALYSLSGRPTESGHFDPAGGWFWVVRASFLQLSLPLKVRPFGTSRQSRVNYQALHSGRPEHSLYLINTMLVAQVFAQLIRLPAASFRRGSWGPALTRCTLGVGKHLRGRLNAHFSAYIPGVPFSLGFCPLNLRHFHNPQLQPLSPLGPLLSAMSPYPCVVNQHVPSGRKR